MSFTSRCTSGERAMQANLNLVIDFRICGRAVSNWNSAFANQSSGSSGLKARNLGVTAAAIGGVSSGTLTVSSVDIFNVFC